jgi:hypothetical protein
MNQATSQDMVVWPRRRFLQVVLGIAGTIPLIPIPGDGKKRSGVSLHEADYYHAVGQKQERR